MYCPNCGARIKRDFDICIKCGTKLSDIKKASFLKVKQKRKEYQPELVVYSTAFPYDLSYKGTLLWCIFFGWAGGHLYFVQRYFKAICMTIMSFIFLIFAIPFGIFMQTGDIGFLTPFMSKMVNTGLYIIPCALGAINVILWFFDLVKIVTKHFPVPVVMPEKPNGETK